MRPTRRTQPYRKRPARPPGQVLDAMKRGATAYGKNPQDPVRLAAKKRRVRRHS
jgi:hypothetical protein